MSLTRQFFREFRPLFRLLEEPFGRSPAYIGYPQRSLLEDPFFRFPETARPAVDLSEQGNNYVVEADLPGVPKENINVRIGDGGRSVTIEGKIVDRRGPAAEAPQQTAAEGTTEPTQTTDGMSPSTSLGECGTAANIRDAGTKAVTTTPESTQLSTERAFVGSSTFTRTVWLPRRVDPSGVTAKLSDGVLTVTVPKVEDPGSVEIPVQ